MTLPAFENDLQLVVPLWQGGGHPGVADGAHALADLVSPSTTRVVVTAPHDPSDAAAPSYTDTATAPASDTVVDLPAISEHLRLTSAALQRRNPRRLLTLGGDCTTDVPAVGHLLRQHPNLHVAWIDAHADLNTPQSSPSGHAHGMPLRVLLGEGHPDLLAATGSAPHLPPSRCLLVGARDLDQPERDYVRDHTLQVVPPEQLRVPEPLAHRLEAWLPVGSPLHLHLDLDVLAPEAFPAVAIPTAGGLTVTELTDVITALRRRGDLVGVTITEHVPAGTESREVLSAVLDALGIPHR